MKINNTLQAIKEDLQEHVGEKVLLKANNGRKKISINEGILEGVYTSIFVIKVEDEFPRTLTYNYSDILTNTVQLNFS